MTYALDMISSCKKEIDALCKKNKPLLEALQNKIKQILENPRHFKPLRYPLQNKRRVHIMKSFVLMYEINENEKTVVLVSFTHHDDAY